MSPGYAVTKLGTVKWCRNPGSGYALSAQLARAASVKGPARLRIFVERPASNGCGDRLVPRRFKVVRRNDGGSSRAISTCPPASTCAVTRAGRSCSCASCSCEAWPADIGAENNPAAIAVMRCNDSSGVVSRISEDSVLSPRKKPSPSLWRPLSVITICRRQPPAFSHSVWRTASGRSRRTVMSRQGGGR